ncbi:hypothetical protein KAU37_03070 [Candidatus Bipolaricaulota bacterium]|nr:hypothetical protein [Candidatus Bipolaricaulota bacterium]
MNTFEIYSKQLDLAREKFSRIVDDGKIIYTPAGLPQKLRLEIIDGSVLDVFVSSRHLYSYHWERRHLDGTIYRHDNAPHKRWRHIRTFPKHFHDGSEANEDCKESHISDHPEEALREILRFIGEKLAGG